MIQVVLITHGMMIVYICPFDSSHYIKAYISILSLIMLIPKKKKKKEEKIRLKSTGLSTDVGVVHNHLDNDERGCC